MSGFISVVMSIKGIVFSWNLNKIEKTKCVVGSNSARL